MANDCAYVRNGRFWPIEVKWRRVLDRKALAGIARYPNGLVAARTDRVAEAQGVRILPVPTLLLRLSTIAHLNDGPSGSS